MAKKPWIRALWLFCLFSLSGILAAADTLTSNITTKLDQLAYSGETNRHSLSNYAIYSNTNYLDSFQLGLGYKSTHLKDSTINSYKQNQININANLFQYLDFLRSRTGLHTGLYSLSTRSQYISSIGLLGISLLTYRKNLYLDLYLARSNYNEKQFSDETNPLDQFSSSIEFSPGLDQSWLSIQYYATKNAQLNRHEVYLQSAIIEWTQFFRNTGFPAPDKLILGTHIGEANYLVLFRQHTINNHPDIQNAAYWASINWGISDFIDSGVSLAHFTFSTDTNLSYNANFTSIYLDIRW